MTSAKKLLRSLAESAQEGTRPWMTVFARSWRLIASARLGDSPVRKDSGGNFVKVRSLSPPPRLLKELGKL